MRANINLERIHNYIADLFTAAGLKEEFSHYILSVSCDDDPYHKTLHLNLELKAIHTVSLSLRPRIVRSTMTLL